MRLILIITLILTAGFPVVAQVDSVKTRKETKEAPADLKKLLDEITRKEVKKAGGDAELEIDGLLIDETKTKSGRDFYDIFYRDWEAPVNARNYSIFIIEKPFRLTTTQLEIKINETLVYQSFLQPRSDYVEMIAEEAVAQTKLYLQNYEEIIRQLEGDDRSGSGIY